MMKTISNKTTKIVKVDPTISILLLFYFILISYYTFHSTYLLTRNADEEDENSEIHYLNELH